MENLGCVTFRETAAARRPATPSPSRAAAGHRRHRPRARPHVVRRPGDDEVVERHLAQRGLRHVHGDAGHRRLPARLGTLVSFGLAAAAAFDTDALAAPARSSSRCVAPTTPRACSTSSPTRRARPSSACSSSTSGAEAFRDGHPPLPEAARLREHRDHRPLGRHRGGHRRAGPADHGHLDLPGRLPAGQRRAVGDGTGLTLSAAAVPLPASDDEPASSGTCRSCCASSGDGVGTRQGSCSRTPTTIDLGSTGLGRGQRPRHGFYRVRYDADLLAGVDRRRPGEPDRYRALHLVNDTWASRHGRAGPLADFLDLARLFADETHRNVWAALIGGLDYLYRMMPPADRPKDRGVHSRPRRPGRGPGQFEEKGREKAT